MPQRTWPKARLLSSTIVTAQATAAPVMPKCGTSTRLAATLMARLAALSASTQVLLPPISSTVPTLPAARLTSMARHRIVIACAPAG